MEYLFRHNDMHEGDNGHAARVGAMRSTRARDKNKGINALRLRADAHETTNEEGLESPPTIAKCLIFNLLRISRA